MLIDPYRFSHDENFAETFMLLHVENGQIYERTGFPIVDVVGSGAVTTAQAKFGSQSFDNPGTESENNNYVRVTGSPTDFIFPGEFTLEGWFRLRAYRTTYMGLFSNRINFPQAGFLQFAVRSAGSVHDLIFNSSQGGFFTALDTVPLNTWLHLCVTRDDEDIVRIFMNGVNQGNQTSNFISGTIGGAVSGVTAFDVGRGHAGDNADFDGWFEEIRVTKACRYTENFDPPTAPFPPFP